MAYKSPKVFISYSHDSPDQVPHIFALANRLRGDGIDCIIDQDVILPPEGWPQWIEKQIRDSDFVLMVCTEVYCQGLPEEEQSEKELELRWEEHLNYNEIYDTGALNSKFIPVFLKRGDPSHISGPLRDRNHYSVGTEKGYKELYRRLVDQQRAQFIPWINKWHPF